MLHFAKRYFWDFKPLSHSASKWSLFLMHTKTNSPKIMVSQLLLRNISTVSCIATPNSLSLWLSGSMLCVNQTFWTRVTAFSMKAGSKVCDHKVKLLFDICIIQWTFFSFIQLHWNITLQKFFTQSLSWIFFK